METEDYVQPRAGAKDTDDVDVANEAKRHGLRYDI